MGNEAVMGISRQRENKAGKASAKTSVNAIDNFQLTISQNIRSRFSATPPSSSLSA